jgi:hypothetical protein
MLVSWHSAVNAMRVNIPADVRTQLDYQKRPQLAPEKRSLCTTSWCISSMLVMPLSVTMPLSKSPRDLAAVMTASSVDEKYANMHSCEMAEAWWLMHASNLRRQAAGSHTG